MVQEYTGLIRVILPRNRDGSGIYRYNQGVRPYEQTQPGKKPQTIMFTCSFFFFFTVLGTQYEQDILGHQILVQ